jgi:Fe-S-cluster containining protein
MAIGDQGEQDHSSLCDAATAAFRLVDQVAEGVVRLLNSTGEHRIACRRGCNACCTPFVRATHAEATAIAAWLLAPERTEWLRRFREQVALWHAAVGPEVTRLEKLIRRRDSLPPPEPELPPYAEAARTYHRRKLMCPFNAGDGSCEIYPFRPVACRALYVADTSEYCSPDANREVSVVRHAKLTEIVCLARRVLRGASAAAGHDTVSALPAGVERALAVLEGAPR